jgi:hypothetical protein
VDDESGDVRPPRFDVLLVNAVIADQRIGHGHDLAFIGRIGENLLVARHGGIETNLAARRGGGAEAFAMEHGAIFQSQNRFHQSNQSGTRARDARGGSGRVKDYQNGCGPVPG